ncbi:EF-P 5-aminopentanol modification-associated protein YfmH [Streptococcus himalayensis]|uniref:Peptidase M16 n=1 Tax=Streptococcus himalayensis TaxID=1888195 RepID=A0A917A3Z1_9STRE|nr:pitrilysin family protein [Streptococcus himalayensis]GGE23912.1 peptidase M16 [Streptococcus himalayensis]
MDDIQLNKREYAGVGETLYRTILPNGLRLFLVPKADFHETYGMMTTRFGSIDTEVIGQDGEVVTYPNGMAHFLEHKLFEDENGQDLLNEFVKLGAESNAFTSFTKTSYLFSATNRVKESVNLLQTLVSTGHFTSDSVEREKGIIGQEIEMYQDDPDYRLFSQTLANLYPNSPLSADIAGSLDSIQQIQVDDLQENFSLFYHPSNMSLFLVGNINVQEVLEWVQETQESIHYPHKYSFSRAAIPLNPIVATETMRMDVATPKLAIGLRGKDKIEDYELYRYKIALKLLFAMMFGWTSKRFQHYYETGKLDTSLTLEVEVEKEFHFVMLTMDTMEPLSISHQMRSAIRQFAKDQDVSEEHLDIIKSEMFGDFLHGLNSLDYIATQYETHVDGENLFDMPKILQSMSLTDVLEIGKRFIEQADVVDFTIFPK